MAALAQANSIRLRRASLMRWMHVRSAAESHQRAAELILEPDPILSSMLVLGLLQRVRQVGPVQAERLLELTVAGYLLFNLSLEIALVLGAVLVVSGPTVVGPLLEFIRPSKTVNSVLKWEGTLADPIGATLGVVVFNAVVAGHETVGRGIGGFLLSVGIGAGFGLVGAVLVLAWVRWFKPNQSQAVPGTLMFVVAMVVCADLLRDDTGLITGLVIGAILANRQPRGIEPHGQAIQRAKLLRAWRERIGTLTTFLIGILFIVIVATALIYGLSGGPVARVLGVASTGPGGVLLVGSTPVGRAIGRALTDQGLTVVVWTGNDDNARAAEADGLTLYRGDPTEDATAGVPSDLDELDYALAVGDDEALNAMIATDLSEYLSRPGLPATRRPRTHRGLLQQGAGAVR